MYKLTVSGLDEARAEMRGFSERRTASVFVSAMNRTAYDVRDAIKAEMPRVFDRPTPYTLNSLFVKPARLDRLQAEVYFKDDLGTSRLGIPATRYLLPHVLGGSRRAKGFEEALRAAGHLPSGYSAVPGPYAKLDQYGNMQRGQIIQILSQLRITRTAGHDRNLPLNTKKENRTKIRAALRKAGGRYFVIPVGKAGARGGVYLRGYHGHREVFPVVTFVRTVSYRRRFEFDEITARVGNARFPVHLGFAVSASAARLAARTAAGG